MDDLENDRVDCNFIASKHCLLGKLRKTTVALLIVCVFYVVMVELFIVMVVVRVRLKLRWVPYNAT